MLHNLPQIRNIPSFCKKSFISLALITLAGCTNITHLKIKAENPTDPVSPKEKTEQVEKIDMSYFEKMAKTCNVDNGWNEQYEAIYQSVLKEFTNDENFNYFLDSLPNIEEKRNYVFSIGSLWTSNTAFKRETAFTKNGGIIVTYNLLDSDKKLPLAEKKETIRMLIKDALIVSQNSCSKSRIDQVNKSNDSVIFRASFEQNRGKKLLGQFDNPIQKF